MHKATVKILRGEFKMPESIKRKKILAKRKMYYYDDEEDFEWIYDMELETNKIFIELD